MISVYSVVFTLMLFSELSRRSVTVAMPATETGDSLTEQGALGALLGDELMSEPVVVPPLHRQSLLMDSIRDEDWNPKTVVSDTRLKGHGLRGPNSAVAQVLPRLTHRSLSDTPAAYSLKMDRRDIDLDMLRCMIGRVYRPCWEA